MNESISFNISSFSISMKIKLKLLKYLPFLLCLYSSVYSQDGIIKIDKNLDVPIRLEEIKILRTENKMVSQLNIESESWEAMEIGFTEFFNKQHSEPQVESQIEEQIKEQIERRIEQQYMRLIV